MSTAVADRVPDEIDAELPDTDDGTIELGVLEGRICDVAARIAIVTCHWLGLITEFADRDGWRASGCRSAAHWLSWRCGLSLSAAYEHLRADRALRRLPRVRAEFAAGRLSYSKVRALTRIAETPGGENGSYGDEDLVVLAKSATAAQLDRIARGVRRAGGESDEAGRAMTRCLRWWYSDDGMFEGHIRLAPRGGRAFPASTQRCHGHA